MQKYSLSLFLEINNSQFTFLVAKIDDQNYCEVEYKLKIPLTGIMEGKISDLDNFSNSIKKNVYLIEQKLKHTFKEIILIINNFNQSFINLSGYKKLNGTQILRENITYILNDLKSYVEINEPKKTIMHIFNTTFKLDHKKIDNLPIGLFGDFYSHELSFLLIDKNDYKNLSNIFDNSGLRIKKILFKSFIKSVYINNQHQNCETFFQIKLSANNSKIFYFENNSLKFEQNFKFGTDLIIQDISKITSLKKEKIKLILNEINLINEFSDKDVVDKKFFEKEPFRKIKKKLIYDIALARIEEIADLLIFKNVNLKNYVRFSKVIFLNIKSKQQIEGLNKVFQTIFSKNGVYDLKLIHDMSSENLLNTTNKLVHFGWNKEVIPTSKIKKSIISRLFETIFD